MTMRGWMVPVVLMLAAGGARVEASSVDCDLTVAGANAAAIDVPAVRAAVNGPHASTRVTVCLVGTFDFGSGTTADNFVSISPTGAVDDLEIVGLDGATIRRGFQPLRHDPASTLGSLSIRDLRFVDSLATAISIFRGNDRVEITGNQIDGVLTAPLTFGANVLTLREGIAVTSAFVEIRGQIRITDNVVDGGSYAGEATVNVNVGVLLASLGAGGNPFAITADVTVARNVVTGWPSVAIGVQGPASVIIEGNHVEPGALANTVANLAACVAVGIGLINNSGTVVKGNTIHKDAALRANGTIPACSPAILVAATANDNVLTANRITGTGSSAVAFPNPPTVVGGERNVFIGNNLTGFTASVATVDLGSRINNTLVGHSGTVAGTRLAENTITGLAPVPGGVGDAVSDAPGP